MRSEQRGYALVVTLWLVTLLGLLAMSFLGGSRTEVRLAGLSRSGAQALAGAESGVWLFIDRLLLQGAPPAGRWREKHEIPNGNVTVDAENEGGKLNLNLARVELIENLLRQTSLLDEHLAALRDAILDWRDVDGDKRSQGAEDGDYQRAGFEYGAKDGPFNSVDELRYVRGMTEEVFRELAPALTVYGRHSGVDERMAGREALLAVPGARADAIEGHLATREGRGSPEGDTLGSEIDRRFLGGAPTQVYRVTATAEVSTVRRSITVFVELDPGRQPPYTVLAWREMPGGGE